MRKFCGLMCGAIFACSLGAAEFLNVKTHPLAGLLDDRLIPVIDAFQKNTTTDAQAALAIKTAHSRAVQKTTRPEQLAVRLDTPVNPNTLKQIADTGATIISSSARWNGVCAHATVSQINALTRLGFVRHIALQSLPHVRQQGSAPNQGDAIMKADQLRASLNLTGAGQTIGVMSTSVTDTAAVGQGTVSGSVPNALVSGTKPQGTGDLPASFQVIDFGPGGGTDEGEGMMEVIHDVAPGAALVFSACGTDQLQCATNVGLLQTAGHCTLSVDDIAFPDEPFFQDGPIAQAMQDNQTAGILHFSAFGNLANQAVLTTYLSVTPSVTTDNAAVPPDGSCFHDWGNGYGAFLPVTVPSHVTVTIILQWDQPYQSFKLGTGSNSDLDLYLCPAKTFNFAQVVGKSENRQTNNGAPAGDPVEIIDYTNTTGGPLTLYLVVNHFQGSRIGSSGNMGNNFRVVFDDDGAGTTPAPIPFNTQMPNHISAYGHSTSKYVVGVGAVDYRQPTIPEPFTSQGGMIPYYFDRTGVGNFFYRYGPDFCAPDGVDTSVFGQSDTDGDSFPNFFGTSCAAPNAVAVAALVAQNAPGITPAQLLSLLQTTATDITMPPLEDQGIPMNGQDVYTGFGLINALAAANAANAPPVITSPLTASGNVGSNFSYTITASGSAPITFNATKLPPGLNFSGATISGIPTAQGTASVALSAQNSSGTDNETLIITIGAPVPVTITAGPTGMLNPSFVGTPVKFSVTASGSGRGITYAWTFGDGGSGSGAQVTHTYAAPGNYTVNVALTDANGQTASGTLTETIQPFKPLVFTSPPTATPPAASIGQTVTFAAAASGNGTVDYAWDFGDGSVGSGSSVTHKYSTAGSYTVTLTVTDGTHQSLTSTLTETIKANVIGTGPDSDGDGVSDSIEILAGTDPNDPNSTPLKDPSAPATPLILSHLRIALQFARANADQIMLTASFPFAAGTPLNGAKLVFNIGGIQNVATLNSQGRGTVKNGGTVGLKINPKTGSATLTLYLSRKAYASTFALDGLLNATTYVPVTIPIQILFQGVVYSVSAKLRYLAVIDRRGIAQ